MTGIVRHNDIGIADNFRRLLKSIDNFSFPPSGFGAVRTSVDVVLTKLSLSLQSWRCSYKVWTLFVQSCRCPCKVDVVLTKCEHCSYKVVVVLAKLTLFEQSCRRSLHEVDVVCTKFCTKKEESWQVNTDIKTASVVLLPQHGSLLRKQLLYRSKLRLTAGLKLCSYFVQILNDNAGAENR